MAPRPVPRLTFWIGGAVALALGPPLLAAGHMALARLGVGNRQAEFGQLYWVALIFAGLPLLVSGGGAARLCAHRALARVAPLETPHVAPAVWSMAIAGAALAYLVAVPAGALPDRSAVWVYYGLGGAPTGALLGWALGGASEAWRCRGVRRQKEQAHAAPAG